MTATSVLVLCTGNLCRSPLAAAELARASVAARVELAVDSAGIAAPEGAAPDRRMLRVAAEAGLDLSAHRSRQVSAAELGSVDLIVGMAVEHLDYVATVCPRAACRTVLLRPAAWRAAALAGRGLDAAEWVRRLCTPGTAGAGDDIADPMGGPLRGYRQMAAEVLDLTTRLVDHWAGR